MSRKLIDGDNAARQELRPYTGDVAPDADSGYDPDRDPAVRSIGIMGAAGGYLDPEVRQRCYKLGAAVAKAGCVLITGACPGLPYDSALGAKQAGGLSVGISPALSRSEHVKKYDSPVDAYDVIIYTGSGLMGREVHNIHSSDVVIIAGGRSGTLGEFCIAFDEGKLIGVLCGSGGIADELSGIVEKMGKVTGAQIVYEREPESLVRKCIDAFHAGHYLRPSTFVETPHQ
ncbi:MAG: LOG family protein [Candidatus Eremiobacteraeota bacterium]|nr:LOG family protein [Candidatus Eremiobacteraeota bacterium]MBC5828002.1 LOG family protein [Candidatus Eremiobacteraeota bacterium]